MNTMNTNLQNNEQPTANCNEFETRVAEHRTQRLGLDYRTAALLCYTPLAFINIGAGILWLATEPKENKQLRFHAIQGLMIVVAAVVLGVLNSVASSSLIAVLGFSAFRLMGLFSSLISLAFLATELYGMYCVYQGHEFKLPYISEIAEKNAVQ